MILWLCRLLLFGFPTLLVTGMAAAQQFAIPEHLPSVHPRVAAIPGNSLDQMKTLLRTDTQAQQTLLAAEHAMQPYTSRHKKDPAWMVSRLQMYWKTHATDVYNRGDIFDHASGHAPAATVRFPGSRDGTTVYGAPRLEDVPPYEDETRGVYLVNRSLPGEPLEWADPSKTGRAIESINSDIMAMAATSAKIYWLTGDEAYARFSYDLFDTYMVGMYYRNEPIDLDHGHSQTIYGMSTFEVIQERILLSLADTFDFLHDYIATRSPDRIPLYTDTFRKWIDVTIRNGVPFNNWDLIEARFIARVGLILDDNSSYTDGRGAQYYLDRVLNLDTTRQ